MTYSIEPNFDNTEFHLYVGILEGGRFYHKKLVYKNTNKIRVALFAKMNNFEVV